MDPKFVANCIEDLDIKLEEVEEKEDELAEGRLAVHDVVEEEEEVADEEEEEVPDKEEEEVPDDKDEVAIEDVTTSRSRSGRRLKKSFRLVEECY